jgi:DNA-binding NarL/FixJ family response regulator
MRQFHVAGSSSCAFYSDSAPIPLEDLFSTRRCCQEISGRPASRAQKDARLLGDGKTTNEIAAEMKITVKTVQDFYQKLKRKLRAENIHQLIRIALLSREGFAEIVVKATRD